MAQFTAFDPHAKTYGSAIEAMLKSLRLFERLVQETLSQHGLTEIVSDCWYPQQLVLDLFRVIYEQVGQKTVKQIGLSFPETALWPADITTVGEALTSIDVAYHMNNRGDIGYYRFEKTSERAGRMICYTPYPCPLDEGIILGTAKKFAPSDAHISLKHDVTEQCRISGGDTCIYLISW